MIESDASGIIQGGLSNFPHRYIFPETQSLVPASEGTRIRDAIENKWHG
jgi:hypothetical protein